MIGMQRRGYFAFTVSCYNPNTDQQQYNHHEQSDQNGFMKIFSTKSETILLHINCFVRISVDEDDLPWLYSNEIWIETRGIAFAIIVDHILNENIFLMFRRGRRHSCIE